MCLYILTDKTSTFDYEPFAMDIYDCAMNRLTAADIDQEVKERAITAMYVQCCLLHVYMRIYMEYNTCIVHHR